MAVRSDERHGKRGAMQFNSYIFILLFLPCFTAAYFLLNRISLLSGKLLIIGAGIVFYLFGGVKTAAVFGFSIVLNLLFALLIVRADSGGRLPGKRLLLTAAVAMNAAGLLVLKYTDFAISSVNSLFGTGFALKGPALPLGISFFTFQQIMYLVSVFRGELGNVSVVDYLAYILYFPKLLMGPLAGPMDLVAQFNDPVLKRCRPENIAAGIKLLCRGLFKKVILADTFSRAVLWGFSHQETASSGDLFLVMLFYTFEIYFDFSGYSDMALGVSEMVNIRLPINFNYPYRALSVRDFWKRWHMSLTGFLTKYVYFPLGGSRKGELRTYVNIMIVFLVSGLWHGANMTFLLWGALYGLLQIAERFVSRRTGRKGSTAAGWAVTFLTVNVLWLLFRSESVSQWTTLLGRMFSFRKMGVSAGLIRAFALPEVTFLVKCAGLGTPLDTVRLITMLVFIGVSALLCLIPERTVRQEGGRGAAGMILCAAVFVWAVLCLSSESTFVYSGF